MPEEEFGDLTDEEIERIAEELQRELEAGEVGVTPLTPEEQEAGAAKMLALLAHYADVVLKRLGLSDLTDEEIERATRK